MTESAHVLLHRTAINTYGGSVRRTVHDLLEGQARCAIALLSVLEAIDRAGGADFGLLTVVETEAIWVEIERLAAVTRDGRQEEVVARIAEILAAADERQEVG